MSCSKCRFLKRVLKPKIAQEFNKNPYFEGTKSFKVIDVYSNKKLVYVRSMLKKCMFKMSRYISSLS